MQAKELGRKQKSKHFNDSNNVYDFKLQNTISLLERANIYEAEKKKIWELVELLKALSQQGEDCEVHPSLEGHRGKHQYSVRASNEERHRALRLKLLYERSYSPKTTADYIMVLKWFYKFLRFGTVDKETPFPEEVRWLKKTVKPNERKEPEYLTPQEVDLLIKSADTIRDKATIAVQFDGGFRPGEHLCINVDDVHLDEKGARAHVKGKTGERSVRLISLQRLIVR